MGTLIRKIQCQLAYSNSHPDSTGPRTGAINIGSPSNPMIEPLLSGGAILNDIAIPIGAIIPPPNPCKIRKIISSVVDCAIEHNKDPMVNNTIEAKKHVWQ